MDLDIDADTRIEGPVFDGRAHRITKNLADNIEHTLSDKGREMVLERLGHVLQHPTGYYESRVRTEAYGSDTAVTDSGVVYGPWLEGTGSRNRTTRFKGYHTFRLIGQKLEREADRLVQHDVDRAVRELS